MAILQAILIFIAIVLFFEALFLLGRTWWNPEKRRIKRQLKQIALEQYKRREVDLTRRRTLSEIPWFNQILLTARIPLISNLERTVLQANLYRPLGFYLLVSAFLFILTFGLLSLYLHILVINLLIAISIALLPILYIYQKKRERVDHFEEQLPEVLDMLARSLRAGHAFTGGLQMISQEFEDPAGTEFRKTLEEINFGVPHEDALKNLATRMPSDDLKLFVISVIIQRESGGNLSEILENIGKLIRERFVLRGHVKTLSAEARLSAVVLTGLPFLVGSFIYLTNPEYLSLLFTDSIGHFMMIAGGIMLTIGIIVMKRMAIIKI
jgi:tight adherence protein B